MDNISSEIEKIKERYSLRQEKNNFLYFTHYAKSERELKYSLVLKNRFKNDSVGKLTIMEIGAGSGDNLLFFHRLGLKWKNIFANELLEDRGVILKENLPTSNIFIGNALDLDFSNKFDIVFQSTVFTSVLDDHFKLKLALKMYEMVKSEGVIIWYDFKYNNPNNTDVKGINRKEIRKLFPLAKGIEFYNVTLAPPIGRKFERFYNLINFLFPFLRSHIIAIVYK